MIGENMDEPLSVKKHTQTEVDRENLTAVCVVCGSVKIYLINNGKSTTQPCVNARKEEARALKAARFKRTEFDDFVPSSGILFVLDETKKRYSV
jgi:hypothetical protein